MEHKSTGFLRRPGDGPRFADRVGQRLLAVDVLAALEGRQRREGVGVFRRADDDGVVARRVEVAVQFAEVAERARGRMGRRGARQGATVDVAQGDDRAAGLRALLEISRAAATAADDDDTDGLPVVGSEADSPRGRAGITRLPIHSLPARSTGRNSTRLQAGLR